MWELVVNNLVQRRVWYMALGILQKIFYDVISNQTFASQKSATSKRMKFSSSQFGTV